MKEVNLPSGAVLKLQVAPFADAKALYQAVLEEVKNVKKVDVDWASIFIELSCVGFSSKKIESALEQCFKRCLYDDKKIDKDTFEPVDSRQDYVVVCLAVAKENIMPFMKGLYAEFQQFLAMTEKSRT